jgi:predicted nucleotidyltransferase
MGVGDGELPSGLQAFVDAVVRAFGHDLRSIVLFGSAAEGRLRATSDVNIIIVLRAFDVARAETLRDPLALAQAGLRLAPMFILDAEVPEAAVAFANKFMDIERRHRVLHGDDPFEHLAIPRAAALARLRQVLLNLVMRTRGRYLAQSLHEERVALIVADLAGPLRAAAGTMLALESRPATAPREALERLAEELGGGTYASALKALSEARERGALPPGVGRTTTLALLELAERMRARAAALS